MLYSADRYASYCAVLATFLGNTQGSAGAQSRA